MNTPPVSHDQLFKELLETFLPEFFALFFPEKARQIDWSTLQFPKTEFFTDVFQGKQRTVDLVADVRTLQGEPESILIHVEIEAEPGPEFPGRMHEYYCLLRLRHRRPVWPVAIYLQARREDTGPASYEEWVLGSRVILFNFHVVPLSNVPYARMPQDNPLAQALAPLLAGHPQDPVGLRLRAYPVIARAAFDQARKALLVNLLETYSPLTEAQSSELQQRMRDNEHEEVREMVTTWQAMGRLEGRLQGRAEGRVEGRVEGLREAVTVALASRFEGLPSELNERLQATSDEAVLTEALRLAVQAGGSEEVLAFLSQPSE